MHWLTTALVWLATRAFRATQAMEQARMEREEARRG